MAVRKFEDPGAEVEEWSRALIFLTSLSFDLEGGGADARTM